MSDIMRPIPFAQLLDWVITEYREKGSIFGVRRIISCDSEKSLPIFDERIEMPFGPAAGPNTQLAQNIIAAYVSGARFFELKTVQVMDGRELSACVNKPCILAADEGYNCEWSTELTVQEAFEEYVKAWVICRILAKELALGDPDGFVFNMSVGYDLAGIKTKKIDGFIEGMKDASGTDIWKECIEDAVTACALFERVDEDYVRGIPAAVSRSITESTLHGCPPDEIERIATYLMRRRISTRSSNAIRPCWAMRLPGRGSMRWDSTMSPSTSTTSWRICSGRTHSRCSGVSSRWERKRVSPSA